MNCGTPALDKLGTVPWEKPGERSAYPSILNELTFEQKVVCFFFFFSWQAESLYLWLQGFLVFDPQKVFSESWLLKL